MSTSTRPTKQERRAAALEKVQAEEAKQRKSRIRRNWIWGGALVAIAGVVTFALLSARPDTSNEARVAPDFTLSASDGTSVTLSDLRGEPVILYFNEGAGCDACILQMAEIEKDPAFKEAGITVLPIVMNTAEQINADRERLGVEAPFLIDDGTVSDAYGTLGTGMHEGLPGHGFVLIDEEGRQLWQGDYPSMWLDPDDLYEEVTSRL